MNPETYHDIKRSALTEALAAIPETNREREIDSLTRKVEDAINRKAKEGAVLILSDEENRIIRAFRTFRAKCKRDGEVFKWQTTRDVRSIIPGDEIGLVHSPEEQNAL